MTIHSKRVLEKSIKSFIANEEIARIARETGFFRRFRKMDATRFF